MQEAGHLGEKCLAIVEKLLREELRRFLPLAHLEFEDVVQDFLVDRVRPLTASLLGQATNDDSLAKLLRTSIRNWLIDRARETGIGHIRRTLEKVLNTASDFERVAAGQDGAGRWRIAGSNAAPWVGSIADLTATAWSVREVRVPKWSSATRRAPLADRDSLVAIIDAVLATAGGSLEIAQLVAVFANRFAAALDPTVASIDDDDHPIDVAATTLDPEETLIADEVALDVASAAAEIAGRLTATEREIVPMLHDSAAVRLKLGKGRTQSAAFTARLKARIRELAGTSGDAEDIVREVIALCGVSDAG
ncbi:hypothetical protein AWC29_05185 [Mycobacterium triplex]|uniref:Uncharacterized protein n=2 Tax=Mycobacterium simiae complex TaxID=2249310 RepID=A0A024K6S7_9MYCO|nr:MULTISPECIES: hypothetical protein [Mycobacterium simiae complex]ORJ64708.1 hypothetical protein B5M45_00020 [Mycobacterium simiae]ORX07576.1 hypothetical protein AWC29_05185 [Mycobacterium triplex]CDO91606.1 hypothetical protein BN973_06015 [Mycobacterium triplex]